MVAISPAHSLKKKFFRVAKTILRRKSPAKNSPIFDISPANSVVACASFTILSNNLKCKFFLSSQLFGVGVWKIENLRAFFHTLRCWTAPKNYPIFDIGVAKPYFTAPDMTILSNNCRYQKKVSLLFRPMWVYGGEFFRNFFGTLRCKSTAKNSPIFDFRPNRSQIWLSNNIIVDVKISFITYLEHCISKGVKFFGVFLTS